MAMVDSTVALLLRALPGSQDLLRGRPPLSDVLAAMPFLPHNVT